MEYLINYSYIKVILASWVSTVSRNPLLNGTPISMGETVALESPAVCTNIGSVTPVNPSLIVIILLFTTLVIMILCKTPAPILRLTPVSVPSA